MAVDEADRDMLIFIWVDDTEKEPPELKAYRFTRIVFGVNASRFLLNATIHTCMLMTLYQVEVPKGYAESKKTSHLRALM